jgi:hypothetical protein
MKQKIHEWETFSCIERKSDVSCIHQPVRIIDNMSNSQPTDAYDLPCGWEPITNKVKTLKEAATDFDEVAKNKTREIKMVRTPDGTYAIWEASNSFWLT